MEKWTFILGQVASPVVAGVTCLKDGCTGEVVRNVYSHQSEREIVARTGGPHCEKCGLTYSKNTSARMVEVIIDGEP